jgi:hypothetical protein
MDDNNSYTLDVVKSDKRYVTIEAFPFEYFVPNLYVNKMIKNPQIGVGHASNDFESISCGECVKSQYKGWYEIKFYQNDAALPLNMESYDTDNYIYFKKDGNQKWPEIRWTSKYYIDNTFRNYNYEESIKYYYVIIVKNKQQKYRIAYYTYDTTIDKTMLSHLSDIWYSKLPKWFIKQFEKNNTKYTTNENIEVSENLKLILYKLGDTIQIITETLNEYKIILIQAKIRGILTRRNILLKPYNKNGNKKQRLN